MSWTRYLLHDFWTAREFNERDEALRVTNRITRRRLHSSSRDLRDSKARIQALEQDLAETTLLLRTIADLCVRKGVLTAAEIAARSEELDAMDGTIDGRISEPPAETT